MPRPRGPQKPWVGRIYQPDTKDYYWVGRFTTRKERDKAVRDARIVLEASPRPTSPTCEEYAEKWLRRYERTHKTSSYKAAKQALKPFLKKFGDVQLTEVRRGEAEDWADHVSQSYVKVVCALFNAAVESEVADRNPFRGLAKGTKGRSEAAPPTEKEFKRLVDACSALGWYAPRMRALVQFAAYSGLRPGELFGLEWADIDFDNMRVHVRRRVYAGELGTPKSGKGRTITLTPPARDALLGQPRETSWVFTSKMGKRMSQPSLSLYWGLVKTKADLQFDFYLATKHFCVHDLYVTRGLSPRAVAEQMGWSLSSTLKMLQVYGHHDIGALEEIDRAFTPVTRLRRVEGA